MNNLSNNLTPDLGNNLLIAMSNKYMNNVVVWVIDDEPSSITSETKVLS